MDVAELWEVDPESLTDVELTAHVRELDAVRSRAEAAMARAVAVWDARKVWADDGATSGDVVAGVSVWAEPVVGGDAGAHGTTVAVDAGDRRRSDGRRAVRSRRWCCWRRRRIAATRRCEVFARDEAVLVEHARRLTVDQTALMLQHWLLRADPDRERRRRGEGDRLHVSSTFDGATVLDGVYASDDGEVVKAAIDAEYERLWRAERASGGPTRTPAQRRAAALAEVARRAVGAEPGRPTIAVTIGLDDLAGTAPVRARRRHRRTGLGRDGPAAGV